MPDFDDEKTREIVSFECKRFLRLMGEVDSKVIDVLRAKFSSPDTFQNISEKDVILENRAIIQSITRGTEIVKQLAGRHYIDHDLGNVAVVVEGYLNFLLETPSVCDEETFIPISNSWERYRVALEDIFLRTINPREVPPDFNNGIDLDTMQRCLYYFSTKEMKKMSAHPNVYGGLDKKDVYLPQESVWKALQTKLAGRKIEGNTAVIQNFILNELRNVLRDKIGASHVSLNIIIVGDELVIRLEDDGAGLNAFQLDSNSKDCIFKKGVSATGSTGLGIANFDTRVASMGSSFYVVSRPRFEGVTSGNLELDEISVAETHERTAPDAGLAHEVFAKHYAEPIRFQSGGTQKKLEKIPFNNVEHGTVFEIRLPISKKEK